MTFDEWGEKLRQAKEIGTIGVEFTLYADWEAERDKLIGALGKIKRDICEPDKITIHIERVLAEVKKI